MSNVNQIPGSVPPIVCDFGWYFGLIPTRLPEFSYVINGITYPPGKTTLGGLSPITLPLATIPSNFGTLPQLQAAFEVPGSFVLNNGLTQQTVKYTGFALSGGLPSFTGCTGGVGTFNVGTPLYDPRFYVDDMPLNALITFDAVDHLGLGLPTTLVPLGSTVINYQWDFGDGQIGYGPFATQTYTYPVVPPGIQATLTVTDATGRTSSCAHRLNLQSLAPIWGTQLRERQSNAHYR